MRKILILAATLTAGLHATITFEPKSVEEVKGWNLDVSANAAFYSGNTDKSEYGTAARVEYGDGATHKHLLIGTFNYGESQDVKTIENGKTHYRYTRKMAENTDFEYFAQDEYDRFKNQKSKIATGINARYSLLKSEKGSKWFVGTGIMGAWERPYETTETARKRDMLKANVYTMAKKNLTDSVKVSGYIFYQPIISDMSDDPVIEPGDYTIDSAVAVETKVTETLSFVTSIEYQINSAPYEGIEKEDTVVKFGINYKIK